jgi:hypothetical protein
MDCLENIIGLSRTDCDCPNLAAVSGESGIENTSLSGLYLDELEGMNLDMIAAANDCARGSLWERMDRSVSNAKIAFRSDLLGCIGKEYRPRRTPWKGQLGQGSYTSTLNLNTATAGVRLSPQIIRSGFLMLKRIGVLVNATTDVTVKVYSNENGSTELGSYTISAIANTLTWGTISPAPLELPMWDVNSACNGYSLKYYVVMELDGFQPKNNKKDCGCGGVKRDYLPWLDITGTKGDVITTAAESMTQTTELNGIVLDIETKCKQSELICSDYMGLDYEEDGLAMQMAYAIRFKAGALLMDELLSTNQINRETMMNREAMMNYKTVYQNSYNEWIGFLCSTIDVGNNDCLVCRNDNGLIMNHVRT